MIAGLVVNYCAYLVLMRGDYCKTTYTNIRFSVTMYFSYFVLFSHFFYSSYFEKKASSLQRESTGKKVN